MTTDSRNEKSLYFEMQHAVAVLRSPPFPVAVRAAAEKRVQRPHKTSNKTSGQRASTPGFGGKKKDPVWQCVENCGACCKLDKGPLFPSPEEIFDDPSDVELHKSMVGPDGWCIHYEKSTRKCSIYAERPYFCRVEPEVFDLLYGIDKKRFNKEACSSCVDTIKVVYGTESEELENYNRAIWNNS